MNQEYLSIYDAVGGQETIDKVVNAFYPRVYADDVLRPLFEAQGGIEEIKRKQRLFLPQFLGGPAFYSQEFGPPAMKFRHERFEITPKHAERWLKCMEEAFKEIGLYNTPAGNAFYERLKKFAPVMVNTPDEN